VAFKIRQTAFLVGPWHRVGPRWGSSRRFRRPTSRLGREHLSPNLTLLGVHHSMPVFDGHCCPSTFSRTAPDCGKHLY